MLSTPSLLESYRQQKAAMDDPFNPFPSFSEWKKTTEQERNNDMERIIINDDELINNTPIITKTPKKSKISNMEKARQIFDNMVNSTGNIPSRKETILAFTSELKISNACASTYSHNIRQKYL